MDLESYVGKMKAYMMAVCVSYAGRCGFHEIDGDDSTVILTIPAENAIGRTVEVKVRILDAGLDVMAYYCKPLLVEDESGSANEKYRIASDIATDYNVYSDKEDAITAHTFCIKDDGDFYLHSFFNKALYYPFTEDGTLPILRDIFYDQPKKLERMCLPIVSALTGRITSEKASEIIRQIREVA